MPLKGLFASSSVNFNIRESNLNKNNTTNKKTKHFIIKRLSKKKYYI